MTDYVQMALETAMKYCAPALAFSIAQTIFCFAGRNNTIRLIPTFIVGFIMLYHICIMVAVIPSVLIVLAVPYLLANVFPSILGVLAGWAVYIIKLVITEYKQLKS